MPGVRLPRFRAEEWPGGFVVNLPEFTASIAAVDGTVLAATEHLYVLRPGATRFHGRRPPEGDVTCVAVEPRRAGRAPRLAVASYDTLHVLDGKGVASLRFPEDHGEVLQLLWAPDVLGRQREDVLYVRFPAITLQHVPRGGPQGTFESIEGTVAGAAAFATDGAGAFACARYEDDDGSVDVWLAVDRKAGVWQRRTLEPPSFFTGVGLAVAGKAVAVSFGGGGVWLTRDMIDGDFVEVEAMRSPLGSETYHERAPIAFEGGAADAALFAAVQHTRTVQHVVRLDAEGRALRIAEVEREENGAQSSGSVITPTVRAFAWDATRRTLWGAAGPAGVMASTAPGAPSPFGASAAS